MSPAGGQPFRAASVPPKGRGCLLQASAPQRSWLGRAGSMWVGRQVLNASREGVASPMWKSHTNVLIQPCVYKL